MQRKCINYQIVPLHRLLLSCDVIFMHMYPHTFIYIISALRIHTSKILCIGVKITSTFDHHFTIATFVFVTIIQSDVKLLFTVYNHICNHEHTIHQSGLHSKYLFEIRIQYYIMHITLLHSLIAFLFLNCIYKLLRHTYFDIRYAINKSIHHAQVHSLKSMDVSNSSLRLLHYNQLALEARSITNHDTKLTLAMFHSSSSDQVASLGGNVFEIILSYLIATDVIISSRVSRSWYRATSNERIWSSLYSTSRYMNSNMQISETNDRENTIIEIELERFNDKYVDTRYYSFTSLNKLLNAEVSFIIELYEKHIITSNNSLVLFSMARINSKRRMKMLIQQLNENEDYISFKMMHARATDSSELHDTIAHVFNSYSNANLRNNPIFMMSIARIILASLMRDEHAADQVFNQDYKHVSIQHSTFNFMRMIQRVGILRLFSHDEYITTSPSILPRIYSQRHLDAFEELLHLYGCDGTSLAIKTDSESGAVLDCVLKVKRSSYRIAYLIECGSRRLFYIDPNNIVTVDENKIILRSAGPISSSVTLILKAITLQLYSKLTEFIILFESNSAPIVILSFVFGALYLIYTKRSIRLSSLILIYLVTTMLKYSYGEILMSTSLADYSLLIIRNIMGYSYIIFCVIVELLFDNSLCFYFIYTCNAYRRIEKIVQLKFNRKASQRKDDEISLGIISNYTMKILFICINICKFSILSNELNNFKNEVFLNINILIQEMNGWFLFVALLLTFIFISTHLTTLCVSYHCESILQVKNNVRQNKCMTCLRQVRSHNGVNSIMQTMMIQCVFHHSLLIVCFMDKVSRYHVQQIELALDFSNSKSEERLEDAVLEHTCSKCMKSILKTQMMIAFSLSCLVVLILYALDNFTNLPASSVFYVMWISIKVLPVIFVLNLLEQNKANYIARFATLNSINKYASSSFIFLSRILNEHM
jgi:hypothetical protein